MNGRILILGVVSTAQRLVYRRTVSIPLHGVPVLPRIFYDSPGR